VKVSFTADRYNAVEIQLHLLLVCKTFKKAYNVIINAACTVNSLTHFSMKTFFFFALMF